MYNKRLDIWKVMALLKCPVCGNTGFGNRNMDSDFRCPVTGCDGIVPVDLERQGVRAWIKPTGGSLDWAGKAQGRDADRSDEGIVLLRAMDDARAEVIGIRSEAGDVSVLEIPAHWKNYRIVQIAPYALKGLARLTRLILPDSIESIGLEAFALCTALERVEFGGNLMLIDAFAFRDCTSLRELRFDRAPECVMESAFAGCYALNEAERSRIYNA